MTAFTSFSNQSLLGALVNLFVAQPEEKAEDMVKRQPQPVVARKPEYVPVLAFEILNDDTASMVDQVYYQELFNVQSYTEYKAFGDGFMLYRDAQDQRGTYIRRDAQLFIEAPAA